MTVMDCVRKITNCLQIAGFQNWVNGKQFTAEKRSKVQLNIICFDVSLSYLKGILS